MRYITFSPLKGCGETDVQPCDTPPCIYEMRPKNGAGTLDSRDAFGYHSVDAIGTWGVGVANLCFEKSGMRSYSDGFSGSRIDFSIRLLDRLNPLQVLV